MTAGDLCPQEENVPRGLGRGVKKNVLNYLLSAHLLGQYGLAKILDVQSKEAS